MTDVPCNGCTACCKGWDIDLTEHDYWSQYDQKNGRLTRKPDGSCVYLGDKGCTIHEKAPYVCRKFDCRVRFLQWMDGLPGSRKTPEDVLVAGEQRLRSLLS